jgi:hypothetical protein
VGTPDRPPAKSGNSTYRSAVRIAVVLDEPTGKWSIARMRSHGERTCHLTVAVHHGRTSLNLIVRPYE